MRRFAAITAHQPDTDDVTGASAGQTTGHVFEGVAGDNIPPPAGAVVPTSQAYLEEIRDEWLQPLIDQLREAERTIGRLEAERDQVAQERDALRSELAASQAPQALDPASVRDVAGARASEALQRAQCPAWRRWWRRVAGGE